jgi:hypothetical protein
MQMIAVADSGTDVAACAKSLALHGAQQPLVGLANEDLDEALWAAFRRHDTTAVTEGLLRRYLHQRRDNRQRMRGARHG